ncbi:hypothetical protein [Pyrobaculum aerophilum]|uniref:Uncharacterized protein n=1 Tax=Pyrobaculum aerophilum TaxID=13773 RepID=A0A371R4F3_9CREN|nr:hypothetical protein [Pyrobaculum aerophilum]RFA93814.1 hypothetical protein CGL51_12300 [Pyrobaculum aerophilum]RFA98635.1 hypothetical protein CGL52_06320 [Pyrobaculum aerophilum]
MSIYDIIGNFLLQLRFRYGVEEVDDSVELVNLVKSQEEGVEKTYIYSPPGRPRPYLISAMLSPPYVALAVADLDDVRQIHADIPIEDVEEATTVVVDNYAPFILPLKKDDGVIYGVLGFKTVVESDVLTGGFFETLLEDFELNSDKYFSSIVNKLTELKQK